MEKAVRLPRGASWPRLPGGISLSGALSLVAVACVLVVVSVPRLRCLALEENEVDARFTARILARGLSQIEGGGTNTKQVSIRDLLRRTDVGDLLSDAETLERGLVLRRHGYLFEITRLSPDFSLSYATSRLLGGKGSLSSILAVRAWPWAYGSTGRSAVLATAGGALLVHANLPVRWEGLEGRGEDLGELEGWRPVTE